MTRITVPCLLKSLFFLGVFLLLAVPAAAQVTQLNAWANLLTNTNPGTISYTTTTTNTFTMSAGSNRVTLVGVAFETSGATTISAIDVRLDNSTGTQFSQVVRSTGSQREHCYLGVLLDSQVPNGTHTVYLSATLASGTITGVHIWAGTFQGVTQAVPTGTAIAANNSAATNVTFGTAVAYNANSITTYMVAGGNTATGVTHVGGFTSQGTSWSGDQSTSIAQVSNAAAGNYAGTSTVTWTGTSTRSAIAVASLNPAAAGATTTLGNGVAGTTATICPGAAGQKLDGFSFVNSAGTNPVTALTVTTTNQAAIASMQIWNEAGTAQYFATVNNPGSNTWNFSGGTSIPVTTTIANFKVLATYQGHATAPAGNTATTAVVSAFTTANTMAGTDTADTTLTLDNLTPAAGASWGTITPGDAQVTLNWTYGTAGESVVIVRYTANTDTTLPTDGTTYVVGNGYGTGGTVRYVGSAANPQNWVDNVGLVNGTTYYYRIFEYDACLNYVATAGTAPWSTGQTPNRTTTIGNGTVPGSSALCPGGSLTDLDAFTLVTSAGTDTVTAVTATLSPAGAFNNVGTIAITDDAGTTVYWTGAPTGDATAITLTTPIPVSALSATFHIRIQPKTHPAMPAVPGASYATQGIISAFTCTNQQSGSNTVAGSGTLTIDNASPADPTWGTITPGSGQTVLNWTNPGTDFAAVLILRKAGSAVTDTPAEGTIYTAGNTIGTSTVIYAGALQTFTDTGLTNGTSYYYRIFARDGCVNYSMGSDAGPYVYQTAVTTLPPSASAASCNQILVSAPYSGDADGDSATAVSRGPSATGPWTAACTGLTGASPRICTDNGVAASSTYYYQVTFSDADGVNGTNPQVIGPFSTPACAVNNTTIGTLTAVNSNCGTATAPSPGAIIATAAFTGDEDLDGYVTFEYNTSNTWPGTAACTASGPSPRQCTITGLTSGSTYWVRATFTDPDGVVGTNPTAGVSTGVALPACAGDSVAPTVTMLAPTDGAVISGVETIKVQVYDAGGTGGLTVQYQLDSTTGGWTAMSSANPYGSCGTNCLTYIATLAAAPSAGYHYVAVRAADAAGNATIVTTGFKATAAGAGTGKLLRRTHGSELCIDCHALQTHNSQNTSTKYGSWAMDCLACHTPHKTTNIYLVRNQINTPNSGSKSVNFWNTAGVAANSFATPTASGSGVNVCEVCHTKTKNLDGTARSRNNSSTDWTKHYTGNCLGCHPHGKGFAAGESEGGASCSGCHSSIWNRMQAIGGSTYKHTLAVDTFNDDSVAWGSPLNSNAAAVRSCVNMCHDDHPHTATDDASPTLHYNLAYDDSSTNATRAAATRTTATKAKADFDNSLAGGGMCLSCHKNPVESGVTPAHPAIAQAGYNAGAHNHVSVTTYAPSATAPSHRATTTPIVTSATATLTINKPTGTVQGDLMIANIAWSTGTTNNTSTPTLSGWTLLTSTRGTGTNPYRNGAVLWKLAGAAEPVSYAFAIGGTASAWVVTGTISSFYNTDQTSPIDVAGTHQWNNTASATNTALSITTLTNNDLVVFFSQVGIANAAHSAWTTATAGAMTEIYDSTLAAAMNVGGATLTLATAGSTGNGTVTITSATSGAVLVALRPVITSSSQNWALTLHDTSTFTRNCTKCHWDSADGTAPTAGATAIGGVHGGANPSLLMGSTNPGGVPASFICYRCHGGSSTGADYSGKKVYQDGTKAYKHPMDADTVHASVTEYNNAAWGNAIGASGRHANCQDCHDPHDAQKSIKQGTITASTTTTLTDSAMNGRWAVANQWVGSLLYVPSLAAGQNTRSITASTTTGQLTVAAWTAAPAAGSAYYILDNKADGALQGSWGAQLSSNPALWTAPASGNFTKQVIAAGSGLEAMLCLKCHSSYYWGAGTPPNGLSPNGTVSTPVETDVAMEFNPNNRSGHPVLASLNNFAGSSAPKPLAAAQMVAPWNLNVGTQTMSCSDCHNTDAASPAAQGPHGSAVSFIIKNGAAKPGWPTASATAAGFATTFCSDCHVNANVHGRDAAHQTNCYKCHIVIPHGGKMSRLIGDNNGTMPARYAYSNTIANMYIQSFTKESSDANYLQTSCQSGSTGCTNHNTACTENW